jgi:uncharacterized integral membrane protein (TIGR00697 family)
MRHTDAPPRYLGVLLALNVTFLLVSDFTGSRIIAMFGVGVSVTVFYFPFTYLIGDVLTEVYGYARARCVIWISMFCSVAGSGLAKAQLLVPAASFFTYDSAFQHIFSPGVKVSIAGLAAFFAGDICNSYVLAKMKIWDQGKRHSFSRPLLAKVSIPRCSTESRCTVFYPAIFCFGVLA